jgi:DNA-directed RNA polymerase specialized sigma24 family protein
MILDRFIGRKSYSDEKILEEIRKGNKDFLVHLYETFYREAGHFILKNGGKEKDIADCLQEVIIHLWEIVQDKNYNLPGKLKDVTLHSVRSLWVRKKQLGKQDSINTAYDLEVPVPDSPEDPWMKRLKILSDNLRLMAQSKKDILYYTYFEKWDDKRIAKAVSIYKTEDIHEQRMKTLDKFENILKGAYVSRDLID